MQAAVPSPPLKPRHSKAELWRRLSNRVLNRRLATVLVTTAVLSLAGAACGASRHPSVPPAVGRLLVTQTIDPSGGIPSEGAYSYVRVEHQDGTKVLEERLR